MCRMRPEIRRQASRIGVFVQAHAGSPGRVCRADTRFCWTGAALVGVQLGCCFVAPQRIFIPFAAHISLSVTRPYCALIFICRAAQGHDPCIGAGRSRWPVPRALFAGPCAAISPSTVASEDRGIRTGRRSALAAGHAEAESAVSGRCFERISKKILRRKRFFSASGSNWIYIQLFYPPLSVYTALSAVRFS